MACSSAIVLPNIPKGNSYDPHNDSWSIAASSSATNATTTASTIITIASASTLYDYY